MPDLFKYPPHPKTIRQFRLRRPPQHPLVVRAGPLADPLAADGKLPAAHVPDVLGDLIGPDVEQRLVDLWEEGANVILLNVDLRRIPRIHARRTPRVVGAPQIHVPLRVDRLQAHVREGILRHGPEEVVVPLVGVGVDEEAVGGETVVEIDDVGEVGGGLAAAGGAWDLKAGVWAGIGAVDERDGVAVQCGQPKYSIKGLSFRKGGPYRSRQ